jgi:uncharacterized membrane protein
VRQSGARPARDLRAGARTGARWALAAVLAGAGVAHFTAAEEFLAQTPSWLPRRPAIVAVSGALEIALAAALLLWRTRRRTVGAAVAGFFVLVFPGNVYQAVAATDGFGLDTPAARWTRLAFQPLLVLWALWCTEAWPRRAADRAEAP